MADDPETKSRRALLAFGSLVGVTGIGILSPGLKDAFLAGLNSYFPLHLYLDAPPWLGVVLIVLAIAVLLAAFMGQSRIERGLSRMMEGRSGTLGTVLAIKHIGFAPVVRDIRRQELPPDLSQRDLRHLAVDLSPELTNPSPLLESAVAKQARMPDQINAILGINPEADLAYFGVVQAPFQFLAGYQLSSWTRLQLFEWHRHEHRWAALKPGDGPDLGVTNSINVIGLGGDVAIATEVSYKIADADILASMPDVGQIVRVQVTNPALDCITHEGQVQALATHFRAALDQTRNIASGNRVHVFCAAPMSVGFALGRMVSRTLHPPVWAYAYERAAAKPYPWGLAVNGTPGPGQIVRT